MGLEEGLSYIVEHLSCEDEDFNFFSCFLFQKIFAFLFI